VSATSLSHVIRNLSSQLAKSLHSGKAFIPDAQATEHYIREAEGHLSKARQFFDHNKGRIMSDIIDRLMSMGSMGPEIALQLLGMVIDAVGTGEEWTGENLDQLGELTEQLANKVRGIKNQKGQ